MCQVPGSVQQGELGLQVDREHQQLLAELWSTGATLDQVRIKKMKNLQKKMVRK